jgi:hypothetical protein
MMALRKATDAELLESHARHAGSTTRIAEDFGMSPRATATRLRRLGIPPMSSSAAQRIAMPAAKAFAVPRLPSELPPIHEIVEHRKRVAARTIEASKARELIRVPVKMRGPIALVAIGDPHVDDQGCDWTRLERDLNTINRTEGMFAVHVGDMTNNWGGRLTHLWAQQSTTAAEAIALAKHVFDLAPPLLFVGGNHDSMPGPLQHALDDTIKGKAGLSNDSGVRVEFQFPGGRSMRMHVRHDFPGRSMYSTVHGMRRELREGYRDHLLIAGHLHCDEAAIVPVETEGIVSTLVRVSGYKLADHYAQTHRFVSKRMAPSVACVINPAAGPADQIKLWWDLEEAAEVLRWMRSRAA